MGLNETKAGIRRRPRGGVTIRCAGAQSAVSLARGNRAARRGVQTAIRAEPQAARTQAESQAFRFGPREAGD